MTRVRLAAVACLFLVTLSLNSLAAGQDGFSGADSDSDGKVTAEEMETYVSGKLEGFNRFKELMKALDTDENGSLSEEEFEGRMAAIQTVMASDPPKAEMKPADDKKSSADKKKRPRQGRRQRRPDKGLKVGQEAPTFKLKSLDGESETDLADFKGKKPVVLVFGSYS